MQTPDSVGPSCSTTTGRVFSSKPIVTLGGCASDTRATMAKRMEEFGLIDRLLASRELKAVVRKAIAQEPSERFGSVREFKEALEAALTLTTSGGAGEAGAE